MTPTAHEMPSGIVYAGETPCGIPTVSADPDWDVCGTICMRDCGRRG